MIWEESKWSVECSSWECRGGLENVLKLEGNIQTLPNDIDKNQENTPKSKGDYEKKKETHLKNKRILGGLDGMRRLNHDLIKKLWRLRGDIDS